MSSPLRAPSYGGGSTRRGPMHPGPQPSRTPIHILDLKCTLERIPGDKNVFLILTFFSSNFRLFHVRSFKNRSNIFKNEFYVFVLFLELWDRS